MDICVYDDFAAAIFPSNMSSMCTELRVRKSNTRLAKPDQFYMVGTNVILSIIFSITSLGLMLCVKQSAKSPVSSWK